MNPAPRQYRTVSQGAAWAIVALFALAVLVAAVSSALAVRAVNSGIASRASIAQLCQAGNESRDQQVTLWTHLIQISVPPPHQTAAQKAQRARLTRSFLAYVHQVFAPRDCNHLSGG